MGDNKQGTVSAVSDKRLQEIDFIKFAAINFMVFVHTYEIYTYDAFFESTAYEKPIVYAFNYLIEFLGGAPAAPIFMFCMGLGITFSRKATPSKLLKRGGLLMLIGLLVNFFEEILPVILEAPGLEEIIEEWPGLFANDVYFFFGLTFFFFAGAVALKKPVIITGAATVLALIGGFFLPYIDFCQENEVANLVLGLLVRTDDYSFFPFTSWIVFPTVGFLFGMLLKKVDNKKKLYTYLAIVSAVVMIVVSAVGLGLGYENSMLNALECEDADYYSPNFFSQMWALAFIGLWIPLWNAISSRIKEGTLKRVVRWGSKNIMPIYVIQWLVIALLTPVLYLSSNIIFTYGACAVVTFLTFAITKIYVNIKGKCRKAEKHVPAYQQLSHTSE